MIGDHEARDQASPRQRVRIAIVEAQCQARKPSSFLAVELRIGRISPKDVLHVTDSSEGGNRGELRIQLQGAMSQPDRFGVAFAGRRIILRYGAEITIIGGEVLRSPSRR